MLQNFVSSSINLHIFVHVIINVSETVKTRALVSVVSNLFYFVFETGLLVKSRVKLSQFTQLIKSVKATDRKSFKKFANLHINIAQYVDK